MIAMIKDIMNANDTAVPNSREMAILKENFPSCFRADGSFDIERFKEFLSDKIAVTGEGYELKFLGKNYARLLASIDTTTVVVPNEEHNSKPENMNSENIYISGDNLDGLKHLLKSYSGQVKCIYIDPPYNTGTDGFVYNDQFNFTVEELSEKLSISEEQAQRILDLTKRGSASHSAWLMFMYSRLLLAKDLLKDNGVIFISIDENEHANLKLLCDDIFGEENYIGEIIRKTKSMTGDDGNGFNLQHEALLIYARIKSNLHLAGEEKSFDSYSNPDDDPRGDWCSGDPSAKSGGETTYYGIENPYTKKIDFPPKGRYWAFSKSTLEEYIKTGKIKFKTNYGDNERGFIFKRYKADATSKFNPLNSLFIENEYMNQNATTELRSLLEGDYFTYPKPIKFLFDIIKCNVRDNDIVLDFFSGSATTAHAVMKLNAEDGGNRKFIMVQLPEKVKEGSEAEKAGFNTIDQIGIERIIRAAKKIKEEFPDTKVDLGFRHFILAEPEQNTLDKLEKFDPTENKLFADKDILSDFGKPTVLATWLVRDGYGLTADAEELNFAGYNGYYIGKHLYLIDPELSNKAIEAIVVKYETDGSFNPENVVLFGYSFTWTEMEALKINLKRLKDTEKNLRINFDIRY
jgi:adenine-specific DNA-methyltransferase